MEFHTTCEAPLRAQRVEILEVAPTAEGPLALRQPSKHEQTNKSRTKQTTS
jgi:hypothetical protein